MNELSKERHLRLLFWPTARGPVRANITGRLEFSTFSDTQCIVYLDTYIWLISMVNVGKYFLHRASGIAKKT